MKIYQVHEKAGEWEDSYDAIIATCDTRKLANKKLKLAKAAEKDAPDHIRDIWGDNDPEYYIVEIEVETEGKQ